MRTLMLYIYSTRNAEYIICLSDVNEWHNKQCQRNGPHLTIFALILMERTNILTFVHVVIQSVGILFFSKQNELIQNESFCQSL